MDDQKRQPIISYDCDDLPFFFMFSNTTLITSHKFVQLLMEWVFPNPLDAH